MNNKIILMAIATVLLMATTTAFTMDVNGGYDSQTATYADELQDGVQCVPDDGNFTIKVTDANANSNLVVFIDGNVMPKVWVSPWTPDTNGSYGLTTEAATWDGNVMTSNGGNGTSGATLNINVSSITDGLRRICILEDGNNGVGVDKTGTLIDNSTHCEWVGIKPDSTTHTNYAITHADGNGYCKTSVGNLAAFVGTIEDNTGYGRIEPSGANTFDISADSINFDTTIVWSNANKIEVTATQLVNQEAKLTFLKPEVHSSKFEVRKNDSACSTCSGITSNNGQIYFTTTGFSVYEVKDLPAGDSPGGGGTTFVPASIIGDLAGGDIVGAVGGINNLALIVIIGIVVVILIGAKVKK